MAVPSSPESPTGPASPGCLGPPGIAASPSWGRLSPPSAIPGWVLLTQGFKPARSLLLIRPSPADPHTGLHVRQPPQMGGSIVQGCQATGLGSIPPLPRVRTLGGLPCFTLATLSAYRFSYPALPSVWGPVWLSLGRPRLGIYLHVWGPGPGPHCLAFWGRRRPCRPVIPYGCVSPGRYLPVNSSRCLTMAPNPVTCRYGSGAQLYHLPLR